MTDHKKNGHFRQWQPHDSGGNQNQDNSRRRGRSDRQNAGHGRRH